MNFFFRSQAEKTLEELMNRAKDKQAAIDTIESWCEYEDYDVDSLEEDFYNDTVEELAERFGIELDEPEDEDE